MAATATVNAQRTAVVRIVPEDGGHNNGHGHAKQETKSAQQHGRSECGLPWFHPAW